MIKIYNSLTREKEEFKPQIAGCVKIYSCGVTVYDDCHIGHARSLYIFEVIRRYLEYRGYKVELVRNITDIDDKIINRAKELEVDWKDLVNKCIGRYYKDLEALDIKKADEEPRATENIKDMIKYIQALIDKNYAYITESGVYFRVRKFRDYGRLSGQSIDQMREGAKTAKDETKDDPLDFALWKKAKKDEPCWDSPWGEGRPGWHIECSVMSQKFLKTDTLDIHGGGRDLIFPHHENERAQAEAFKEKPFANCWIHHGLLTMNSRKMAKSLGNFITIKDAVNKYSANTLKVFYLQAHYSSSIDFSSQRMEEAKKAYQRISILVNKLVKEVGGKSSSPDSSVPGGRAGRLRQNFIEAMDDDFNMPRGLAALFDLINECNKLLEGDDKLKNLKLTYAADIIREITDVFGLTFLKPEPVKISPQEIEEKIAQRLKYRAQNKFKEADKIRKELKEQGVILEDTKGGTVWRSEL